MQKFGKNSLKRNPTEIGYNSKIDKTKVCSKSNPYFADFLVLSSKNSYIFLFAVLVLLLPLLVANSSLFISSIGGNLPALLGHSYFLNTSPNFNKCPQNSLLQIDNFEVSNLLKDDLIVYRDGQKFSIGKFILQTQIENEVVIAVSETDADNNAKCIPAKCYVGIVKSQNIFVGNLFATIGKFRAPIILCSSFVIAMELFGIFKTAVFTKPKFQKP
ncbi:MAG: hypothetical protein RSC44_01710 [Clostridia bacterium]